MHTGEIADMAEGARIDQSGPVSIHSLLLRRDEYNSPEVVGLHAIESWAPSGT
jgi:hypothetical protein